MKKKTIYECDCCGGEIYNIAMSSIFEDFPISRVKLVLSNGNNLMKWAHICDGCCRAVGSHLMDLAQERRGDCGED